MKIVFSSFYRNDYKIILNQFIKTQSFRIHGQQPILLPIKLVVKNIISFFGPKEQRKIFKPNKTKRNIFFALQSPLHKKAFDDKFDYKFEYVKRLKILEDPDVIIYRNMNIIKTSDKLLIAIIQTIAIIFLFPFYLFKKELRNIISLHFIQFIEWVSIINDLKSIKGINLYMFDAYENDSSFISFLAMKESYNVYIFPSAIPIISFYKYFYCTHFVLSSPYHRDELKKLNFNYKCHTIIDGPIDEFAILTNSFNRRSSENYRYEFGYFSSAALLRKKMNLMYYDHEFTSEMETHKLIKKYLKKYDIEKFIILLHPKEKKDNQTFEYCKNIYREFFEIDNLNFGDMNKPSYSYYNKINIKVCSSMSTHASIIFCGYKSIFSALTHNKNGYAKSNFLNTLVFNEKDLEKALNLHKKISNKNFIIENRLKEYVYSNYQKIAEYY